jgi:hypothetical protein
VPLVLHLTAKHWPQSSSLLHDGAELHGTAVEPPWHAQVGDVPYEFQIALMSPGAP